MAYKQKTVAYNFDPSAKASMILLLDQFDESLVSIHEIKNMITVPGSIVFDSHHAVVLASLIAPYYPDWADKLLAPLETYQARTTEEFRIAQLELIERLR